MLCVNISIISRGDMDSLIGRKARFMKLYSPRQAVNIAFLSLVAKLHTFAIQASKRGGQSMNEIFIYSKDITLSPGY